MINITKIRDNKKYIVTNSATPVVETAYYSAVCIAANVRNILYKNRGRQMTPREVLIEALRDGMSFTLQQVTRACYSLAGRDTNVVKRKRPDCLIFARVTNKIRKEHPERDGRTLTVYQFNDAGTQPATPAKRNVRAERITKATYVSTPLYVKRKSKAMLRTAPTPTATGM